MNKRISLLFEDVHFAIDSLQANNELLREWLKENEQVMNSCNNMDNTLKAMQEKYDQLEEILSKKNLEE